MAPRNRTTSFLNPVQGGTIGRADQGVDIAAPPGSAVVDPVPGISKYVGTIRNWFQGQPFQWFKVTSGPLKGRYWYGAEQINFTTGPGSTVRQGQQIGTIAPSGTGTEFGFATPSGQTLARATTGYKEGQPTRAGSAFANLVRSGRANGIGGTLNLTVPGYVPKPYRGWVSTAAQQTGMPPAVIAAQINTESGFDPNVTSAAGAQGIAQFEPGTWKTYGKGSAYNPSAALPAYIKYMNTLLAQYNGNVRDALAAYNAGPANISAGYGYADSILAKAGAPRTVTAGSPSTFGGTRPGGQPSGSGNSDSGQAVTQLFTDYEAEVNTPRTAPTSSFTPASQAGWKAPFTWWWQSFSGNYAKENNG